METLTSTIHLPEAILAEILARLPLRSISRFKSVSKTWKSTLESVYFRRLFVSLHKNSSPGWSLISCEGKELIGFHGCKTWDLPKSLASYVPLSLQYCTASSNGLVLLERHRPDDYSCYVGNLVLQQWVKIRPTDVNSCVIGLVTRVEKDGVWTSKIVHCSTLVSTLVVKTLNGTVYFNRRLEPNVLVSHDFYSESDQCRVVPFPEPLNHNNCNDVLTTSGGFVMYISRILAQKGENIFKIWRLNNDESWQLLWEMPITAYYFYPWQCIRLIVILFFYGVILAVVWGDTWRPRWLMQSVLPWWMELVPCLPLEMIDTFFISDKKEEQR
ncbi:hypothetical protein F2Q68_00038684 [Brassica cretica]|uniref:F-box domain-containing protein n=1 Tax=Brassica cretica TaxID=69181 RepID=A0A8S9MIQ8_BRACR|nr:hypothetical protein F2Q68_00038684 [Brassica cretica]